MLFRSHSQAGAEYPLTISEVKGGVSTNCNSTRITNTSCVCHSYIVSNCNVGDWICTYPPVGGNVSTIDGCIGVDCDVARSISKCGEDECSKQFVRES